MEITCTDHNAFRSWPAAELAKMVDLLGAANARVVAGTTTKTKFHELEMTVGVHHNPLGLLADVSLRPHVDPMGVMT